MSWEAEASGLGSVDEADCICICRRRCALSASKKAAEGSGERLLFRRLCACRRLMSGSCGQRLVDGSGLGLGIGMERIRFTAELNDWHRRS